MFHLDQNVLFDTNLIENNFKGYNKQFFTPQPLRAVGVLFSPMVSGFRHSGRQEGYWEKVCPGCI